MKTEEVNIHLEFLKIRYDKIKTFANLLIGFCLSLIIFITGIIIKGGATAFDGVISIAYAICFSFIVYANFSISRERLLKKTSQIIMEKKT